MFSYRENFDLIAHVEKESRNKLKVQLDPKHKMYFKKINFSRSNSQFLLLKSGISFLQMKMIVVLYWSKHDHLIVPQSQKGTPPK